MYYNQLFEANKDSVYNLWKTLNPIINPQKCKGYSQIAKLMYDGKLITDKQNISDAINMHFCDVGRKLQSQLENRTLNFKDFMPAKKKKKKFLDTDKQGRHSFWNKKLKTKQSARSRYDRHKNDQTMPWNICKYFGKNLQQSHWDGHIPWWYENR